MRSHIGRSHIRRRALGALALACVVGLGTACSGDDKSPTWQGGGSGSGSAAGGGSSAAPEPAPPIGGKLTAPAEGSDDAPITTDLTFELVNAVEAAVKVTDADGKEVEGELDAQTKKWVPKKKLEYGTEYTATFTGTDAEGRTGTTTSAFTTMKKPKNQIRATSHLGDGAVVGVAMPMIVKFSKAIPESYRDDVERNMPVTTTPEQEGTWRWISSTEIHYRGKEYWKPGTKIHYEVNVAGLPMAKGAYGRTDITVDLKVGSSLIMTVDNKTKQMTVTKDGKKVKTIPISLGKKETPSSSGTMIVMEKLKKTVFDTFDELGPEEGYRTDIEYAQRLTWSGQYIHSAPWSVGQQGRTNVSHGCVNVSPANAKWLFEQTKVGDPITVKGTEEKLKNGNGWTDWNMSWSEYKKGSALD